MAKFCPTCGEPLQFENAEICPKCGVRLTSPAPPVHTGVTRSGQHAIIVTVAVLAFIIMTAAVLLYSGAGTGLSVPRTGPAVPPAVSSVTVPPVQRTHTPSEIFRGHLAAGEDYSVTTNLADTDTTRYTVKLVGPDTADFDLYIRKEGSLNSYDYTSRNIRSTEQVDVMYPSTGNYTIRVHANRGSGDFVLFIDYAYRT